MRLLTSSENYKNIKLNEAVHKEKLPCHELQVATVNSIVNLKPENVDNYRKLKNDYEECAKRYILI